MQPTRWRKVDELDSSSGKTAAALVVHQGIGGVSMSGVGIGVGVGRGSFDIGGLSRLRKVDELDSSSGKTAALVVVVHQA